eukprot:COSAG06_NODE_9268_length_1943_cov_1.258134_2_plen_49_part_00
MFSTRINKRMLFQIATGMSGGIGTVITFLIALKEPDNEALALANASSV